MKRFMRSSWAWFFVLLASASISRAQLSYTTTWVGNTYGNQSTYVGNAARSMWVAPEGVIYTASMWDENEGSIAIYQHGQNVGSIGAHNETQGGAITGDSTNIFAALPYNTSIGGSGCVGRYKRSTKSRDLVFQVSAVTTERRADVITGLADTGTLLYASDYPGNRVRVFTVDGVWQQDWSITSPGRIAVDGSGNVWVAQMKQGTIQKFSPSGAVLNTIHMGSGARPSELYYDKAGDQLMVGDQGPNMNIQIYGNLAGTPALVGTFGVKGGYLDTTTGTKGQTGAKRFTRVVGIGKDSSGNLCVLNNPWGGSWDLGRNGETDIHVYNSGRSLVYTLQALNFEGVGAPDPGTGGNNLYSGNNLYTGSSGGYLANTIDPITNPSDQRIQTSDPSRGQHFGMVAYVSGHRILVTAAQNCDVLYLYYFSTTSGYTAVPIDSIPGARFGTNVSTVKIRSGFWLDTNGDLWVGYSNNRGITHYPLTGFDSTGKPLWGSGVATPIPTGSAITSLGRILYLPATDQMILADAGTTSTGTVDWTSLGGKVEVYNGWSKTPASPTLTISLDKTNNPKTLAAAGNYLFVGHVHTIPNIDAYNLTTGALDISMTSSNPNVSIGNDVDSMYGIRAYQTSGGQYIVSKDNYNNNSIIIDRLSLSVVNGAGERANSPAAGATILPGPPAPERYRRRSTTQSRRVLP